MCLGASLAVSKVDWMVVIAVASMAELLVDVMVEKMAEKRVV